MSRLQAPDWRKLDQAARDRAYNNAAAVAGSAAIVADWDERSAEMRRRHPAHLDLAYGPRERNRTDFLKAADNAPTLVFIHGGYWQMRSKEFFTFCAAGPLAHGINVALMGYTLAPEATLDEMAAEIRAGLDHLQKALPGLGGDPARIIASGWSAGGHLVAMTLDHPAVRAGLAISGLYDLEPIRHTYVNDKLGLDEATVRRNSPLLMPGFGAVPLVLVDGDAELPLMRQQTTDFALYRVQQGLPVQFEEIPGADHFTIMEQMADPAGRISLLVRALAAGLAA